MDAVWVDAFVCYNCNNYLWVELFARFFINMRLPALATQVGVGSGVVGIMNVIKRAGNGNIYCASARSLGLFISFTCKAGVGTGGVALVCGRGRETVNATGKVVWGTAAAKTILAVNR